MQFAVIAYDGEDKDAFQRRMTVRDAHIALGNQLVAQGHMLYGLVILNDDAKTIGSLMIFDFATRKELDEWLAVEPYVTGDVWRRIQVHPCRVGPTFDKRTKD